MTGDIDNSLRQFNVEVSFYKGAGLGQKLKASKPVSVIYFT